MFKIIVDAKDFGTIFNAIKVNLKITHMKISNTGTLLLLGLGAWAIYKYNNMSEEEQTAMKEKAKKLFDEHVSPFVSNALSLGNEGKEKMQEIFAK